MKQKSIQDYSDKIKIGNFSYRYYLLSKNDEKIRMNISQDNKLYTAGVYSITLLSKSLKYIFILTVQICEVKNLDHFQEQRPSQTLCIKRFTLCCATKQGMGGKKQSSKMGLLTYLCVWKSYFRRPCKRLGPHFLQADNCPK